MARKRGFAITRSSNAIAVTGAMCWRWSIMPSSRSMNNCSAGCRRFGIKRRAPRGKRQELKAKATNVTEAIAAIGHSPSLLAQLSSIEAEIAKLDDRLTEMNQPRDLAISLEDLREVLHERASEIGALLRGDVAGVG